MARRLRVIFVGVLVAMLAVLAACGGGASAPSAEQSPTQSDQQSDEVASSETGGSVESGDTSPIVFGAAIAETGWMSFYDIPALNAFKLWMEDANAAGGIHGRKIELMVRDTKTDQALEPRVAEELLAAGAEILILSCGYDHSAPAAFVAESAGVLSFSLCSGSPKSGVQGVGPLHFTDGTGTPGEAATVAEYAYNVKGWRTAYLLVDTSEEYSITACDYFKERFTELAPDGIVGEDTFKQTDTSIGAQVTRLKGLNPQPDFIYVCSFPPGGASAVSQIRNAGIDTPIFTGTTFDGKEWLKAVPHLSDFYMTAYANVYGENPRPEVTAFFQRYEKTFGGLPPGAIAITGYTTGEIIGKALEMNDGNTDGATLAHTIETFKDEPFLVGPTTFTPELHINLDRPLTIIEIRDGNFVPLEEYRPEKVPDPFDG